MTLCVCHCCLLSKSGSSAKKNDIQQMTEEIYKHCDIFYITYGTVYYAISFFSLGWQEQIQLYPWSQFQHSKKDGHLKIFERIQDVSF